MATISALVNRCVAYQAPPTGDTWANIHSGVGNTVYDVAVGANCGFSYCDASPAWRGIRRGILTFDVSSQAGKTISACNLSFISEGRQDPGPWLPSGALYNCTPTNPASIVAADYNQCGTTLYSNVIAYVDYPEPPAAGTFTLNAAGLLALNTAIGSASKIFSLCFRETLYDVANIEPTLIWPYFSDYLVLGFSVTTSIVVQSEEGQRVSGLVHYWSPNTYRLEIFRGGLNTQYVPPVGNERPLDSIPAKPAPEPSRLFYDMWMAQTSAEVKMGLFGTTNPSFAVWAAWWKQWGNTVLF